MIERSGATTSPHTKLRYHTLADGFLPQVKKKGAEKPKEYAELQAKYAKMQEMDMARYVSVGLHSRSLLVVFFTVLGIGATSKKDRVVSV